MKPYTFTLFLNLTLFCSSAVAGALGLDWGMDASAIYKKGVELVKSGEQKQITIYTTERLPKNISNTAQYALYVHATHGLQKIVRVSNQFEDDVYGSKGKKEFAQLKQSLTEKYGEPSDGMEIVGLKLWDKSDEFYQCLAYQGCGIWARIFKSADASIMIELRGLRRGEGYLMLHYDSFKWDEILDERNNKERESNKDAL